MTIKNSKTKKRKIVITGAGGYVGSTLVAALKNDYEIVGFGHPASRKALEGQAARFICADITDYRKLSRAAKGAYAIIHTASPTRDSWCVAHPYEALRAIVYGARCVRRTAEENNVPLLIHFSTQAVYSNFKKRRMPLREDMALEPDTLYGALKAAAEQELLEPAHLRTTNYALRTVILRPGNIYGLGGSVLRGNVAHAFAENAKKGKTLVLHGGGRQKADFVHVRDIARLVARILKKPAPKRQVVVNAGSGKAASVKEIARLTAHYAKSAPRLVNKKALKETIAADRWLSISKAKRLYGWKAEITLKEGVKELISFLKNC